MIGGLYTKLIIAVVAVLVLGYIGLTIFNAGKASVYAKLQADRITILQDGKKIDQEALAADDDTLRCLLIDCSVPDNQKP